MSATRAVKDGSTPLTTRGLAAAAVAFLCGVLPAPDLHATDPLTLVPGDVAMVIAFRDLEGSAAKLNRFIRTIDQDFAGFDLDEVQRGFNLADGMLDTSAPAFMVLTRPQFEAASFALVFTPKDVSVFNEKVSGKDKRIKRCLSAQGPYYLMMRDGVAVVGHRRRAMRCFRRLSSEQSLAALLDEQQKAIFASSDVLVHIPLAMWREKINYFAGIVGNLAGPAFAMQHDPAMFEAVTSTVNWLVNGIRAMIDQMDSMTLAFDFDGQTFRLTHYHSFAPGQSVSSYLGQVRRHDMDMWSMLPDRPFLLIGAADWACPPEISMIHRFMEFLFSTESVMEDIPAGVRRKLRETTLACYGQMRGSYFMVTSPRGAIHPVQMLGGYVMEDAAAGIKQLLFVQENANEAMSTFLGEHFAGEFVRRTSGGRTFYEMRIDLDQMSPLMRDHTAALYGEDVRVQEAVIGKHHVVYSTGGPATGVHELMGVEASGRPIGRNRHLGKIVSRLPPEPHVVIIADLGRCVAFGPLLMRLGLAATQTDLPREPMRIDYAAPPGPMLGWACELGPHFLRGQLVIGADDARRLVRLSRAEAKGPRGGERPLPPRPPR